MYFLGSPKFGLTSLATITALKIAVKINKTMHMYVIDFFTISNHQLYIYGKI